MHLKVDTIYKIALASLLLLPTLITSVELNLLLGLIFIIPFLFDFKNKFPLTLLFIILPLAFILCIALASSVFYKVLITNIIRDFFYLIKPILFILIGYYFIYKIKDKTSIFKTIIYVALVFAILHLYNVIIFFIDYNFNINHLRNFAGRNNFLEMFAALLLLTNKGKQLFFINTKYISIIKFVIICSFIFYFSRTLTVSFIILLLSIKGYLKITPKGLLYMSGFIVLILFFYAYLFSIDLERKADGIEGFFYKLKIAPSEIFFTEKMDITNHVNLWDHWRAYEAQKAFEQLKNTPNGIGYLFGKGAGSLVDLEFVAPLNTEGMRYISMLHNGYAFICFKSGLIGVICYIMFLSFIYLQGNNISTNAKEQIINNLLSGMAIILLFTTLIVSGIYNPSNISDSIVLGALLYLSHYHRRTQEIALQKGGL